MSTIYQQQTPESLRGLFLFRKGNGVPHHSHTKSESAIGLYVM